MSLRKVSISVEVNGALLPVTDCEIKESVHGEFAAVDLKSSIAMWRFSGISAPKKGDTINVFFGFDDELEHVFSGICDNTRFRWGKDVVEVTGRDEGAVLSQTKNVLTKYQYKNQTVGKIVKQIAEDHGLKVDIDDPGTLAGAEQHGSHSLMPNADNPWSLIQSLAKQTGCHARVRKGTLYFKKDDQDEGTFTVHWTPSADQKSKLDNILMDDFETEDQESRNGDVKVKVYSWLPTKVEKVFAEATVKRADGSKGGKTKSTVSSSSKRPRRRSRKSTKEIQTPTIVIRKPGLTQEKAEQLAKSVAKDVASRQIIHSGSIEYARDLQLRKRLKIKCHALDIFGYDEQNTMITELSHSFSMSTGLVSKFKSLLRPEAE